MSVPAIVSLLSDTISTAITGQAYDAAESLEGMTGLTIEADFIYGSGGTSCSATVQTSFGTGGPWRDIARFDFDTESATRYVTIRNADAEIISDYSELSAEGLNSGLLGSRLRAVRTSVGTYAGSTQLAVRAKVF